MRVRIHRGPREIGGSCVELESAGARLVLDVGRPLSAGPDEHVPLPAVRGLADGADRGLLGVLISHPHLDHYGLLDQVHPGVPRYAGREAAASVTAARFFSPTGPDLRPSGHLEDRRPLRLGPFTVTPYLVDHSGLDAYALTIDAGDRRLLYTGDLRGHGRKAKLFERMLAAPPSDVRRPHPHARGHARAGRYGSGRQSVARLLNRAAEEPLGGRVTSKGLVNRSLLA